MGLLRELLILVGLSIPIVALAHRLHIPPLVGFFVVGPHGVGLIDAPDQIRTLSELGVALLLFAVGLDLSLSHVRRWARSVFAGGGLQVGATLGSVPAPCSPWSSAFRCGRPSSTARWRRCRPPPS